MKLRSPEAYWLLKNGIMNSYPSLEEDVTCDVVVVGAGVTGALISHALIEAGYDTVVIDKRDVATGSTSATTAMLQYEIDTPMTQLSSMIGEEGALCCYRAGVESIDKLERLVQELRPDCSFERKESLQVAHDQEAVEALYGEYRLRKEHGFEVEWLDTEQIRERYLMASHPGILSKCGASVDAYRLAHELFRKNSECGLRVYDHTGIQRISYDTPVVITTDAWARLTCKQVIFCTGYETLDMFSKHYADIFSTFACVSEQQINLYDELKDVLIWDTDSPYIYMRTTDDGRLLVGGEDVYYSNSLMRDKVKNIKAQKLAKKLEELFPTLNFKEDFNWAGTFGMTKDGLPYIGRHPQYPNAIFVLGMGGNGITFSVQGMDLVLKLLSGQDDPLLHHYRFDR